MAAPKQYAQILRRSELEAAIIAVAEAHGPQLSDVTTSDLWERLGYETGEDLIALKYKIHLDED